jgi:peptide/nickel transport system substrate-binding protein
MNRMSSLFINHKLTLYILNVIMMTAMFFFPGCSKTESVDSGNESVTIGLSERPKSLDPRVATDVSSSRIHQLVYNSLVRKDGNSQIVPDLAESFEIQDDRTYRFRLRRNIKFHNGSTLTASDVKATFDGILSEELGSLKKGAYEKLESITVEDEYTIVFKTTEPFAPFLINMVQGILPKEQAEKVQPSQSIQPIGTGPFMLDKQEDETYILRSFDQCFTGKPNLSRVIIRVVPDDTIRLMELEKGSIDFLQNNVPPDSLPRLRSNPDLKIMQAPGTSFYYLGFNFRLNYPPSDIRVRKALGLAIDRKEIITHILGGLASQASGVLPEGHWAYNKDIPPMPFNPSEAEKLLDEAGYPLKGNARFSLELKCAQNKQSRRLSEVIQAELANIGVNLEIRSLEWGTYYDDILRGNFQTYFMSWVGVTDPDIFYSLFHSRSYPPNGRNRGQFHSSEMDQLLENGRKTLDIDARAAIYKRIQALAADQLPYINLWHSDNIAVMKKNLIGYQMYPAGDFDSFAKVRWNSVGK